MIDWIKMRMRWKSSGSRRITRADLGKGVFVEEVGKQAIQLLGLEHQATHEVVNRENGHGLGNENIFRLFQETQTGGGEDG